MRRSSGRLLLTVVLFCPTAVYAFAVSAQGGDQGGLADEVRGDKEKERAEVEAQMRALHEKLRKYSPAEWELTVRREERHRDLEPMAVAAMGRARVA